MMLVSASMYTKQAVGHQNSTAYSVEGRLTEAESHKHVRKHLGNDIHRELAMAVQNVILKLYFGTLPPFLASG